MEQITGFCDSSHGAKSYEDSLSFLPFEPTMSIYNNALAKEPRES